MKNRRAALAEILCLICVLLACYCLRQQVARSWTFAGSDTYTYLGGASELAEKHRYAFRLPAWYPDHAVEPPLGYCRMPGYSLFLAAISDRSEQGSAPNYVAIFSRVKAVQRVLDLLTCVLVFLMARRFCGQRAAWLALLLAGAYPPLLFFSASILTETLATLLTTVVLGLLLYALPGPMRHGEVAQPNLRPAQRIAWIAAGAAVALGGLVRVDGLFLLATLPVPLLAYRDGRSLRTLLLSLLTFSLCFAPWPVRNALRFGNAHPLGGQCDTRGRAIEHTAFYGWFATWLERESQTPETLYCLLRPECVSTVATFPPEAFASSEERDEVQRLFMLRQREGLSERVDQGFKDLTLRRLRARPVHTLLLLPLRRAFHLWVSSQDQPLRATQALPWPSVVGPVRRALLPLNVTLLGLGLMGLGFLLADRTRRPFGWLALLVLALRTGLISLIGFVDNRYVLEVTPLVIVLCGALFGQPFRPNSPPRSASS